MFVVALHPFINGGHVVSCQLIVCRIKVFCFDKNEEKPVFWLFNKLQKGEFYHHPKIVRINGVKCYVSGMKNYDRQGKLDFLILVSFNRPEESLEYYKKRWQIETF